MWYENLKIGNITAEFLKVYTEISSNKIKDLMSNIWRNEIKPSDWKTGLIIKLLQRGILKNVKLRWITMLPVMNSFRKDSDRQDKKWSWRQVKKRTGRISDRQRSERAIIHSTQHHWTSKWMVSNVVYTRYWSRHLTPYTEKAYETS